MNSLCIPLLKSLGHTDLDTALELEGARFMVDRVNWPDAFPYAPFCGGRIARTRESLVVDFRVSGLDLRVQNLEDGGSVWEDSCCEIFIQAPDGTEYFNFEVNAAGKMVVCHGPGRSGRIPVPAEDRERIVRMAQFEGLQDYKGGIWSWRITLLIPFDVMGIDPDALPARLRGNIYKCGDKTAHPHFLTWNPVSTASPDFHRPEFFGEFILSE